jgi:hypothetical protein
MSRTTSLVSLMAVVILAACVPTAPVVQGKVVAVEQGGGVIRVQDELKPDAAPLAMDITTAEIGGPPKPGDIVRIVYRAGASSNRALRVMNLSRHQADR